MALSWRGVHVVRISLRTKVPLAAAAVHAFRAVAELHQSTSRRFAWPGARAGRPCAQVAPAPGAAQRPWSQRHGVRELGEAPQHHCISVTPV